MYYEQFSKNLCECCQNNKVSIKHKNKQINFDLSKIFLLRSELTLSKAQYEENIFFKEAYKMRLQGKKG